MKGLEKHLLFSTLIALVAGLVTVPAAWGESPDSTKAEGGVAVRLVVEAARSVADLDRRKVERAIVVALTSDDECPVRIVGRDEQAPIRVSVRLKKWLDRRSPDGTERFDPRLGRDVPGYQYEVWGVYDLEIRLAGQKEPIERDRDESFRSSAREGRNPLFDAQAQAEEEAFERIVRGIRREVCELAREDLERSEAGS